MLQTTQSLLRVALPNDSDGVLSLALHWNEARDRRDPNYLGWMRFQLPQQSDGEMQKGDEKADVEKVDDEPFPLEKFTDAPSPKKPSPQLCLYDSVLDISAPRLPLPTQYGSTRTCLLLGLHLSTIFGLPQLRPRRLP